MNSTEGLIKKLATSPSSLGRDFSPVLRTFLFFTISFPAISLALFLIRPYAIVIQNPLHGFELLALLFFLITITYLGFKAFIPGEKLKNSFRMVLASSGFAGLVFLARTFESQVFNDIRPFCEIEAIGISVVTTLLIHSIMKKNEYASSTHLAKSIFISLPIIATVILHGLCSLETIHVLLCHVISPLLVPVSYLIITKRRI